MTTGYHPFVHAESMANKAACIDAVTGVVVSYGELEARSNQTAQMFRDWGFCPGEGIVIQCQNVATYLELVWGAHRAGLYYTPVSWHLTATELRYIIENSGAKAFFASSRFAKTARQAVAGLPEDFRRMAMCGPILGFEPYEAQRDRHRAVRIKDEISGSDMLYTSGTTGQPKGVKFPQTGMPIDHADPFELMFRAEGYDDRCVSMSLGPMYHPSSLYTAMCTHRFGGTLVIADRFDPETTLALIEKYRITQLSCVPTHFIRLLKLPETERNQYDVSSLHCVLHTAAPCPSEVKLAMIDWFGPVIFEYYGGTEKVGGTVIRAQEWLAHPGSIGRPVVGAAYVLDETTWQPLPAGEIGAIYFDAGADFAYHGDAAKTRSIHSPQGWKTLGDIGYADAEGYLYLTDRKANMIISGGVNIYPQEAENRIIGHPKVSDVAVFGIPDADMGEAVKAVAQPADWADAGPELAAELIAWCKLELASLKCPRSIDFEPQLPREANGKLYKRLLIERYKERT